MAKFTAGILQPDLLRQDLRISVPDRCLSAALQKRNRLLATAKTALFVLFVFACAGALPSVAHGEVSIWLQSPKPGTNANTVLVYATATSTSAITGWIVYVDDAVAYQTTSSSDKLSHTVSLANGRHLVYARAWDGDDYGTSATLIVQVGQAPASSSALPTPPSNATVLSELQGNPDGWTDCSVCADGTNDTTNYWMAPYQGRPSMTGDSREFYAAGLPWSNVLFIKTLPAYDNASHFLWDFWVYHDPASIGNIWSSEFDLWQVIGGSEFMIGSQCDFGDGYWDTFDSANNRWITNGIPCPRWAASTWHHIQWYVERVSPTQYRYDTLVVDGHGYGLNQVWAVNPVPWPDAVGIQWQLDQSANGNPIHEWTDNVKLTLW
jgi:hypothetical protein